ncbi:MAG: OB-fold domain-containing protein [Sphingobium sp.]
MEKEVATAPDAGELEVPMDAWTQPFWDAAEQGCLRVPGCADCGHVRWPPGPFCPRCQSQRTAWASPGEGRIYTFTIVRSRRDEETDVAHVPALIEFPEAGGIRLIAAIADTPIDRIKIDAPVSLLWSTAQNARIPLFCVRDDGALEQGAPSSSGR